ncbi:hypothetical protein [Nocardioides caldifontis]|uniref:hypothetical protein n=1 Tax=Nocardioides caldifontis TaxID=2588938 RepID=UPI0011DF7A6C|nr:hypothetical protein [Nocardioides caldifontis]
MSEKERLPRPRQVTMAAVMSVVGSVVLVVSLVDTLGRLRSAETRRTIDDFLAQPPGSGLGIDTAQVVELMRVLGYASAVLAATTLVLGVFVAQRHHGARIGLTVAAGLLLLTMPVSGLMPLFVAAAAGLAWTRPARDWFAGRPAAAAAPSPALSEQGPPPSPFPYGGSGGRPEERPVHLPDESPAQQPPPTPEWQPGTAPVQHPDAQGQPWPSPSYPPAPARPPGKRPATVTAAAVLTWAGAGVTAGLAALTGIVVAVAPDAVVDEFDRISADSGADLSLTRQEVLATAWVSVAILLVWSLIAILLAVLAFRRSNVGRVLLTISAAMTALLSLLSIVSLVPGITLVMGIATVVLLYTGGANQWYRKEQPWQQPQWGPPADRPGPW